MASRSSSGSRRGADILDLDRYMRGSRPARACSLDKERLVVDAGVAGPAAARVPAPPSPPSPGSLSGASAASAPSGASAPSAGSGGDAPRKRFSHDSGLSDSSYVRRAHVHHPHSLCRCTGGTRVSAGEARGAGSVRALRAVLERALRDQQAQIARVAQLCEEQAARGDRRPARGGARRPARRPPSDSTELSSSSSDSQNSAQRDKHRTNECRTYKIIMSKLDELGRMFAARRPPAPAPAPAPAAPHAPPAPAPAPRRDSSSVTVSDKLVATDFPQPEQLAARSSRLVERGAGGERRWGGRVLACSVAAPQPARRAGGSRRPSAASGSLRCDEARGSSSANSGAPHFDLEDPVHLYAQAKRLQTLHATTRRARSGGGAPDSPLSSSVLGSGLDSELASRLGRLHSGLGSRGEPSLCALCRAYWRLVRRCLAAPLGAMRGYY